MGVVFIQHGTKFNTANVYSKEILLLKRTFVTIKISKTVVALARLIVALTSVLSRHDK